MKKPIGKLLAALAAALCLLSVPVFAADDVAINETNFPDDNFRSYVSENFDTDGNGKLSATEISAVQEISVRSIQSLKGIEHFENLKQLDCSWNDLTQLDVSMNTALTELSCSENQLTSLDVSKNTALTKLECDNNQLALLDVSKNTALTELDCSDNQLTSLNVSGATALENLNCTYNQLTTLDVSKNPALEELYCGSNQLTTLDVSKNPALEELYCGSNQLTTLDVSGATTLEKLDCTYNQLTSLNVSGATAMKYLQCDSNQLTTLDVSKNTALTSLECAYNQLTTLDVSKNAALTKLDCYGNQLTSLDVSKNTALTYLQCYYNQLTMLDVSKNTALENLLCAGNTYVITLGENNTFDLSTLPDFDVAKASNWIGGTVAGNTLTVTANFVYYDYDCGNFTVQFILVDDRISVAINETNFPDSMFLSYVSYRFDTDGNGSLSTDEIAAVYDIDVGSMNIQSLKGIEYFGVLRNLYCPYNQLTELDVSKNTILTYLQCFSNQLATLDVSKNTALTSLSCGGNQLTSLDVSKNAALKMLNCDDNQLTSLDVSKNTALTYLYCGSDQLTELDVSKNTALKRLGCSKNQLTTLDVSKNTALTYLDCDGNQLTTLDLSENTELGELYCSDNQLTELDVSSNAELYWLYCDNNQLTTLDLSKNTWLWELHCDNNQLTTLDLSCATSLKCMSCSDNAYAIEVGKNNTFDLTMLPGFDVTKASNWVGGTVDGTVLTVNADTVTYDYDCGEGETATFTLTVSKDHTALVKVDAKTATCTEDGNREYWHCSGCGKDFLDEAGTREAAQEDIMIPALGHSFTNYVYNNDATVGADGTETARCDRDGCNATDTRTVAGTALPDPEKPEFVDVQSGAYYAPAVAWAVKNNVVYGTSDTTFSPNEKCTRAHVVAFLWRAMGTPEPTTTKNPFTDVSANSYYYKAVLWAVENGVVYGTSDTTFSPDSPCTRAQVAAFLYRAKNSPKPQTNKNPFTDVKSGAYYYKAVLWAVENGIVYGTSNTTFDPNATCTRAQGVAFLYRAFGK